MMKIAVIGAGAMGSIFGAMLSGAADVFLIDPFEEHVKEINSKGLIIAYNDDSKKKYNITACTDTSIIKSKVELAIIFTKSYATAQAAMTALSILDERGLVLTLQNGLGNLEIIAGIVGDDRAVAGVTSHGGTMVSPGFVKHAGTGHTHIAGNQRNLGAVNRVVETFNSAGIETDISGNLDGLIWGKLIINVGINALAAILKVENGFLGKTVEVENLMARAVWEAVNIADALNIKLPYENPLEQVKKVCRNTAGNRASMLQDILKGARTEVGVINGAIVEKGREMGLPTPYNIFLSEIIEALEATSENRCR
ncbi:MAG: 2-dehydropantoate 2-reductase [Desulfosarcina sp.]|nr:2-dehydropantoate 2-reductase [Desulfobacterales bacterium]